MPMNRAEQYRWCTMTRKVVDTFVVVAIPFFAEYETEGMEEFIRATKRLKNSFNSPALADRTKALIDKESRRLAKQAENSLPEGKKQLTADDCHQAFLRYLFLSDLMLMGAVFSCPAFATSPDWEFVLQWIRDAVHKFESDIDGPPLPEEVWSEKAYKRYHAVLGG